MWRKRHWWGKYIYSFSCNFLFPTTVTILKKSMLRFFCSSWKFREQRHLDIMNFRVMRTALYQMKNYCLIHIAEVANSWSIICHASLVSRFPLGISFLRRKYGQPEYVFYLLWMMLPKYKWPINIMNRRHLHITCIYFPSTHTAPTLTKLTTNWLTALGWIDLGNCFAQLHPIQCYTTALLHHTWLWSMQAPWTQSGVSPIVPIFSSKTIGWIQPIGWRRESGVSPKDMGIPMEVQEWPSPPTDKTVGADSEIITFVSFLQCFQS